LLSREDPNDHVLHHQNAIGLLPKKSRRRERGSQLVVDDVPDESEGHRADQTLGTKPDPMRSRKTDREAEPRDEKPRRDSADKYKLDHSHRAKQVVAELSRADHLLKFKVVISTANLAEEQRGQRVLNHLAIAHSRDLGRPADLEERIPQQ